MFRIFLAFPVPEKLREELKNQCTKYVHLPGFRWTPVSNLHITLFFIGEVEEKNIPIIAQGTKALFAELDPFTLQFDRFEFRGGKNNPSMFWARFQKTAAFTNLSENVYLRVKEYMTITTQFKDPIPHITLARLKKDAEPALVKTDEWKQMELLEINCAELWQTVHVPGGVRYDSIGRFEFKME
ncbi:MAG TPA: RNA 2',3'-cyclic phosphodiesterase [Bacteroidia bacterium]|nr:RNA 2',3'-cyclic phosphodiesterase [Bacteroidia bacterium]